MSDNIPLHLRITGLTPTNDDVDSRRSAVLELSATWGKSRPSEKICEKAAEIAESLGGEGVPSPDLGNEVQVAVQKHASAFLYADRPLEVGVCAGMAAVKMVGGDPGTSGWTVVNIFSTALWSALSFQSVLLDEKRETLRREVLDAARSRSLSGAEKARERVAVADPVELVVTVTEGKPVTTNFKKAIVNQFENLRRNTALDREELDFLWWSLLNRSKLLNKPLADIDEVVRPVALGVEAAGYLRRLPAQVHRDLVLRTCNDDCELDLIELVDRIGADRDALVGGITVNYVNKFPTVFPLLNAIVSGQAVGAGASTKRKLSAWGGRALVEASLSRMMAAGGISE